MNYCYYLKFIQIFSFLEIKKIKVDLLIFFALAGLLSLYNHQLAEWLLQAFLNQKKYLIISSP